MKIILYDGECGFCAASVRFVWKRDREGVFSFAAIQSDRGGRFLAEQGIEEPKLDTMYYLDEEAGRIYERSEAALRVCRQLPRYAILGNLGLLVPRFLRDWVYDRIAANRHRLRGSDQCEIPPEEVRKRFLDEEG